MKKTFMNNSGIRVLEPEIADMMHNGDSLHICSQCRCTFISDADARIKCDDETPKCICPKCGANTEGFILEA